MPRPNYKPDASTSTGRREGQESTLHINVDVLFERVDVLQATVQNLQRQINELSTQTAKSSPTVCHQSTQTEHSNFTSPLDVDTLRDKVRNYQNMDRDIATMKYFIQRDIIPEADEIAKFEPRCRRYLWQLSRFKIQDDIVYRKKMDNDRLTELHQLLVPVCLIPEVLQTLHPSVGHVNIDHTFDKASKMFFWPYMHRDITNFARSCNLCQEPGTCSDSAVHDQHSLTGLQKAVCAITEITKNFINTTKQPMTKRRQHSNRRRHRSTVQPTPKDHQQPHTLPPSAQHQTPKFTRLQPKIAQNLASTSPKKEYRYSITPEPPVSPRRSRNNSPPRRPPLNSPRKTSHPQGPRVTSRSELLPGEHHSYYSVSPTEHSPPPPRLGHDFYSPGRLDSRVSPARYTYHSMDDGPPPPWTFDFY